MIPLHTPTHRRDCGTDWVSLARCIGFEYDFASGVCLTDDAETCPKHWPSLYTEESAHRHKAVTP